MVRANGDDDEDEGRVLKVAWIAESKMTSSDRPKKRRNCGEIRSVRMKRKSEKKSQTRDLVFMKQYKSRPPRPKQSLHQPGSRHGSPMIPTTLVPGGRRTCHEPLRTPTVNELAPA